MLPDKTIKTTYSTLGIGAMLLTVASAQETVSSLWEKVKRNETTNTFDKYITALVFLYSIQAITFRDGLIYKGRSDAN